MAQANRPAKAAEPAQKPEGSQQKRVAEVLGLTTRQVRNLTDEGVLPRRVEKGKPVYDVPACVQAYLKYKQDQEAAKGGPSRAVTADLNLRKLTVEVERAEMELAKEREQLVTIDYMEAQVSGLLQSLRAKCLNLPGKYARELAEATDPADVVEILETGVAELLTALAQAGDDEALDGEDEAPTPAEADDDSTGR